MNKPVPQTPDKRKHALPNFLCMYSNMQQAFYNSEESPSYSTVYHIHTYPPVKSRAGDTINWSKGGVLLLIYFDHELRNNLQLRRYVEYREI